MRFNVFNIGNVFGFFVCLLSIWMTAPGTVPAAELVTVSGTVIYDGSPVCSMVLVNGQYMFTCDGTGEYSLNVPLNELGRITIYCFCDGRAPYRETFTPESGTETRNVYLGGPFGTESTLSVTHTESKVVDTFKLSGTVTIDSTPVVAMVLANGEYAFSSAQDGSFDISNVPTDESGKITLQCFCEGAMPYAETFTPLADGPGGETFTNTIGQTFALIQPGSFTMGAPAGEEGSEEDERPQHSISISKAFYMMTTQVTQGQWSTVMGSNPSYFSGKGDEYPVENVSWNQVQDFITELNRRESTSTYRLPTEAEWEYSCRAGTTTPRYWGEGVGAENAACNGCGTQWDNESTAPVSSFPPNPWGLYDMLGNTWEWTQDWYDANYYAHSPQQDPLADTPSDYTRVLRGGSFRAAPTSIRCAARGHGEPAVWYYTYGFRLVKVK